MPKRQDVPGRLYLLHAVEPYAHARHYLGWTERDVAVRLAEHLSGRGSPLVRAMVGLLGEAGITLVADWPGTRREERRLKNRGGLCRICPVCRAAAGLGPYHPKVQAS